MSYKCRKCNEISEEFETVLVAGDRHHPSVLKCVCGSEELIDMDIPWALGELEQLRKELQALSADDRIWPDTENCRMLRKVLKVAGQNAGQVKDWLEEV